MNLGPVGKLTAEEMDRLARKFGTIPNVRPEAYAAPMDAPRPAATHNPFPVAPDDVPEAAVRALRRTMVRHGQPVDDDLARLLVAMVIAALQQPPVSS